MGRDYLPKAELDLRGWLQNFNTQLGDSGTTYGFAAPEITAIGALIAAYDSECADYIAAEDALRYAKLAKDNAKTPCVEAVRAAVARLQAHPLMTDPIRGTYRITVPDTEPTPIGPPATRPVLQILLTQLYALIISFGDEGNPTSKAKPAGVLGILLQYKKGGPAPASDEEWQTLAIDTNTPYTAVFDSSDAGTVVWLRGCWITARQERGPWSAVYNARIPG